MFQPPVFLCRIAQLANDSLARATQLSRKAAHQLLPCQVKGLKCIPFFRGGPRGHLHKRLVSVGHVGEEFLNVLDHGPAPARPLRKHSAARKADGPNQSTGNSRRLGLFGLALPHSRQVG